uniref:Uncharacterized protein n=1 Tax=Anguilla anguilla TaxID=7936 RepID=A0A0E9WL36_ANGAN
MNKRLYLIKREHKGTKGLAGKLSINKGKLQNTEQRKSKIQKRVETEHEQRHATKRPTANKDPAPESRRRET